MQSSLHADVGREDDGSAASARRDESQRPSHSRKLALCAVLMLLGRVPRVFTHLSQTRLLAVHAQKPKMGKSNKKKASQLVPEAVLSLPAHASALATASPVSIVDTHTHLASTYSWYRSKYKDTQLETIWDFVRAMCLPPAEDADATKNRTRRHTVRSMVDVWCEPATWIDWREIADSAVEGHEKKPAWGTCEYWFAMGKSDEQS